MLSSTQPVSFEYLPDHLASQAARSRRASVRSRRSPVRLRRPEDRLLASATPAGSRRPPCAARSRARCAENARSSADRPPPPEPRAALPAGRHDRRPRRIRRRADRVPSVPAGNRASSTGSRGWRARPPAPRPSPGQALTAAVPVDADRDQHRLAGDHAGLAHPLIARVEDQIGEGFGQGAAGKLCQTRIQPLVHCADRGSRKAVAAQLLGDRLHPRFREGRLFRVETPCTYIAASAATSARSER